MDDLDSLTKEIQTFLNGTPSIKADTQYARQLLNRMDTMAMQGVARARFGRLAQSLEDLTDARTKVNREAKQALDHVVSLVKRSEAWVNWNISRSKESADSIVTATEHLLTRRQVGAYVLNTTLPALGTLEDRATGLSDNDRLMVDVLMSKLLADLRDIDPTPEAPSIGRAMIEAALKSFPDVEALFLWSTSEGPLAWPSSPFVGHTLRLASNFVKVGLQHMLRIPRTSVDYVSWLRDGSDYVESLPESVKAAFSRVFGLAPDGEAEGSPVIDEAIHVGALAETILISSGFPVDITSQIVQHVLHDYLMAYAPARDPFTSPLKRWLWESYKGITQGNFKIVEFLSQGLHRLRSWVEAEMLGVGAVTAFVNVVSTAAIGLYDVVDKILDIVMYVVANMSLRLFSVLDEYLLISKSFVSALMPEHRRRRKAVWAPLMGNVFRYFSAGEKFAIGCAVMDEPPIEIEYAQWASRRIDDLNRIQQQVVVQNLPPVRPMHLPDNVATVDEEMLRLAPLAPSGVRVDKLIGDWVRTWLDSGVPRGIDGSWFATGERVHKSISRYNIDRPEADEAIRATVIAAAHALAARNPEMYKDAVYLTPLAALRKVKVKYSPGLPFIPQFKDRKEVAKVGLLKASARLAEEYLVSGSHPGTVGHAFPKMDVVKLEALLAGKNIRTVVAQELIGNIMMYTSTVETTRRQAPIDAWVMNAVPRSEGGFRPFFEELEKRGHVMATDGHQYDSQLAPVLTIDGLVELRSLGFEDSVAHDVIKTQIRANYFAYTHANIINVLTGEYVRKTGGFMTGGANTSPDNRDSFRLMMMAAWSLATGRDPAEFFITNTLGNAGDDNLVGTDESPAVWDKIFEICRDHFGVTMTRDGEGFKDVDLVGLGVVDTPVRSIPYYQRLGIPVPKWSIASRVPRLMMKRTEMTWRVAKLRDVALYMSHLNGVIGSALLTAHIHDVYVDLAEQYVREASYILLRFWESVERTDERDEDGALVAVHLEPRSVRERYRKANLNTIDKWLRSHRFPSYSDVMEIWLRPQIVEATRMAKNHRKLLTWNPSIGRSDRILYGIMRTRELLWKWIPSHVVKALPEFTGPDITHIMRNSDYVISKFVWLSLYHSQGKVPSDSFYRQVLRENPYASACDPTGFLAWLHTDENVSSLIQEDLEAHRGRVAIATLAYTLMEVGLAAISHAPLFGIVVQLFILGTRDVNRLYSFANHIHMLATGRSSPVISNMMPADPYAWMKQMSVIIAAIVPLRVCGVTGVRWIAGVVPKMVDIWVAAAIVPELPVARHIKSMLNLPNRWDEICQQMASQIQGHPGPGAASFLVVAPTGTGKSTAFVAGLRAYVAIDSWVWVLCPTIAARDGYQNDFIKAGDFQILSKGVVNEPARPVKVLTYMHFLTGRLLEVRPKDVVVFDEMHLGKPENFAVWRVCESVVRVQITATPNYRVQPVADFSHKYGDGRRFVVNVEHVNGELPGLIQDLYANRPQLLHRALIIAPTVAVAEGIVLMLGRLSLNAAVMSSDQPTPPKTGVVVGTTIVDTAVTIEPPPTCLIDIGETIDIVSDFKGFWPEYKATIVAVSADTATQRLGRVGRAGNSIAFVFPKSGTGSPPVIVPSPQDVLSIDEVADTIIEAYGIVVMVSPIRHDLPGLLKYLGLNTDRVVASSTHHTIVLALWIAVRLSSNTGLDQVKNEWLNLRVKPSPHEVVNTLLENLVAAYDGSPLLGVWNTAIDIIDSGGVFCKCEGEILPLSCLVVENRRLGPCGHKVFVVGGDARTSYTPRVETRYVVGKRTLEWYVASLASAIAPPEERPLTHGRSFVPELVGELVQPQLEITYAQRHAHSAFKSCVEYLDIGVPIVVEVAIGAEPKLLATPYGVRIDLSEVTSLARGPMYDTVRFDCEGLGAQVYDVTIGMLFAASCPETWVVILGGVDIKVLRAFQRSGRSMVAARGLTSFVIRPNHARLYASYGVLATFKSVGPMILGSIPRTIVETTSAVREPGALYATIIEGRLRGA